MDHQAIHDALAAVGEAAYYGLARPKDGDRWNYTVFHRVKDTKSSTKTSQTEYFRVAIVREVFVPDEDIEKVADAVLTVAHVKPTDIDTEYEYAIRSNGQVVESASVMFCMPGKKR